MMLVIVMNLVEIILINLIYVLFPILIYFIYGCYTSINKNKYNELFLGFMLLSSLYIFLKFGDSINDNKILLFSNIPIVIAYIKKNYKLGILLSIFLLFYCYSVFSYSIIFMFIKFITYFIVYIITSKNKIKDNDFIAIIAVVQGFFISFEYFFNNTVSLYNIVELFIVVLIFYIITFLILYLFTFINNLTSIVYQVKELEKEKEIKNSLFKLTHEIKNPLAVCKGYLDMINIDDVSKSVKYINIVKQEIDRSLNIMSDFLEFSRIKIKKDIIDVDMLLDDVYESFKILNNSKNIKLKYNQCEDEIYINGDYDRLRQVFLNIIKNSMESITDKGIITINCEVKNSKVYIYVEDNGCGMDEETLNNIKKLFYSNKVHGSGIGVSLSNEIIKAHDGELNYYSSLGKGTKVEIVLNEMK